MSRTKSRARKRRAHAHESAERPDPRGVLGSSRRGSQTDLEQLFSELWTRIACPSNPDERVDANEKLEKLCRRIADDDKARLWPLFDKYVAPTKSKTVNQEDIDDTKAMIAYFVDRKRTGHVPRRIRERL